MKTPKFPAIPKALLKKGKEDLQNHRGFYYYHQKIIHEVEKDGKVWIYSWESDKGEYTQDMITVMTPKCWKTWDGKKWGRKVINPSTWYGCALVYDKQIDKKKYGYTIEELQKKKQKEKTARVNKTKQDTIDSIVSRMKKIPKKVQEWAHENSKHYIIFEAGKKTGFCTNCAAHSEYEERLRNRHYVQCPKCGHIIEARTYKTVPRDTSRFFMWFQKCEGGFLLRTFRLTRRNPDLLGVPTEHISEYLCISMVNGEERWLEKRYFYDRYWKTEEQCEQWYLNKSNNATKNYLSPYCDAYHHERALQGKPKELDYYYPATYGDLEQWLDISKFTLSYIKDDVVTNDGLDLLKMERRFKEVPQIEGLYKNGFETLADNILYEKMWYGMDRFNKNEIELHKFLKIKKETFRMVVSYGLNENIEVAGIEALQNLDKTGLKVEEYPDVLNAFREYQDIRRMVNLSQRLDVKFKKLYKYISSKGDGYHILSTLLSIYEDYIDMCLYDGMDMTDSFNVFPRDIEAAHDSLLRIKEERKAKDEILRQAIKDETLAESIKKYSKRFTLENDSFIIRPARSASEIVMEGQAQHNCVGRAGYIDKMIARKCMILFLRRKEDPDKSYYTIETDMNGNLKQAYAKNNKKTADYEQVIKPLLDQLTKKVQSYGKKHSAAR